MSSIFQPTPAPPSRKIDLRRPPYEKSKLRFSPNCFCATIAAGSPNDLGLRSRKETDRTPAKPTSGKGPAQDLRRYRRFFLRRRWIARDRHKSARVHASTALRADIRLLYNSSSRWRFSSLPGYAVKNVRRGNTETNRPATGLYRSSTARSMCKAPNVLTLSVGEVRCIEAGRQDEARTRLVRRIDDKHPDRLALESANRRS